MEIKEKVKGAKATWLLKAPGNPRSDFRQDFCCCMIKMRAHKGGVRIGKTPKKLASICCP
jgi:hypothetical protein